MKIVEKIECKVPEWAMSAIFNSDYSGVLVTNKVFLDTWFAWLEKKMKDTGASSFIVTQKMDIQSPYFDSNPSFGLASNVYDCVVLFFE